MTEEVQEINYAPVTVIVTYHSNVSHLVSILINLQSQLVPPKRIIVMDTSVNKSGLDVATRFNTNNCEIIVECAQVGIYEAWNRGIELAGSDDVIICNDDLLLPINFIDVMCMSADSIDALCFVPVTPPKDHYYDTVALPYTWFAGVPYTFKDFSATNWFCGFCFYLKRSTINEIGTFDTKFKVWFGDDDYEARLHNHGFEKEKLSIVRLDTCFVYHYGGKSYKYQSEPIQKLIDEDRTYFAEKYGVDMKDLANVTK